MSNSLVSISGLKVFIGVAEGVQDFDTQLFTLAKSATALLENFCRRKFTYQEITETFSTVDTFNIEYDLASGVYPNGNQSGLMLLPGTQRFVLKAYPMDLGASLTVNYDANHNFADPNSLVDPSLYFFDTVGNALYLRKPTAKTVRGLQIVASGGYAIGTNEDAASGADDAVDVLQGVPDDLVMACVTQTLYMFNKYREGNVGIVGADKHSPNYQNNSNLLCSEAMGLAAPYKRILTGRR